MATHPTHDPPPTHVPWAIEAVRERVDAALVASLAERRAEMVALDPAAADLIDELERLISAGGKRLRPAFCVWGHLACGGTDGEPVIRAAAALELLHTFALVHDDVMDEAGERRGVPTTQTLFALRAKDVAPDASFGRSVAVLVGDLGAVLAESLLRRDASSAERVADLKGGSYTVEGPLMIGAALAGASVEMESTLMAFAQPAGQAFQLRDDLTDHDAAPGVTAERVSDLLDRAVAALDGAPLEAEAARALRSLAELLRPDAS